MQIGGSTGFELGVGCDLGATLASGPSQQTLDFNGDMMITTHDIKFQAGMTTPWADVFGLPGITVNNTEIMLGISFTGVPDAFGLSGTVQIGEWWMSRRPAPRLSLHITPVVWFAQGTSQVVRPCMSTRRALPLWHWRVNSLS